jgi:hypothetical protein
MQKLTSQIAALTEQNVQSGINAIETNRPQRYFRQTPQTQQRDNYARDFNIRTPQGGAAGFLPRGRGNDNPNDPECDRCGLHHAVTARCFALGQQCRKCKKLNHYARKCRGAGQPSRPSNEQQQ